MGIEPGNNLKRIVVVGGGIAGLAAAYRLQERHSSELAPCEVMLLEAGSRPGGVIGTTCRDGFILESGPDTLFTDKPWAVDLIRRLDLSDRIIGTSEIHRRTFVAMGKTLHPLPEGFTLLAPTRIWPFLRSGLLTWRGKARMALDLVLPRGQPSPDESLASFVRRRLGAEALERLAQPMIGGIYSADPERLSLQATFPQFLQMEAQHRSLILALRRKRLSASGKTRTKSDSGPRYSLFATLDNGLQALVDALVRRLPAGTVRLGCPVAGIARREKGWTIRLKDGTNIEADGVILAVPAFQTAVLTHDLDGDLARELEAIPYASSVTISLAYRKDAIPHPLDGFGFVVPACEGRTIIACSFSSVKFANRAPAGHALLRTFAGGALQPEPFEWDDERLLTAVRHDLKELLGIETAPLWSHLVRHPQSMPQYHVGHLARLATLERQLRRWPTLKLAGNAYRGVGVPDAIRSGEAAADALLAELTPAQGEGYAGTMLTEPSGACAAGDSLL
ncbi:protoporphyrinogen oxidase [Candidatus Methylomirabilis limnetica]|uniref:protoporphyrinogen oxidase n=1 Tax=Candidatus Methylomirabilis limnetica TaxID=2033718 RepID=UPI001EFCC190|nr:protoporphyrinogen oxidase [Candidatus Methylomirabilis limnetica]